MKCERWETGKQEREWQCRERGTGRDTTKDFERVIEKPTIF